MPEEAGTECAADEFGNAGPVDEVMEEKPDAERVLGDDPRPEDE